MEFKNIEHITVIIKKKYGWFDFTNLNWKKKILSKRNSLLHEEFIVWLYALYFVMISMAVK